MKTEIIVEKGKNGQLTPIKEIVRCKDCKYNIHGMCVNLGGLGTNGQTEVN